VPSAKVVDIAAVMIGNRPIDTKITGIRPGEKIHEALISDEEANRTVERGNYYVIQSILPELANAPEKLGVLQGEYSSSRDLMSRPELFRLFAKNDLLDSGRFEYENKMAA
jgi:UDP-glucose 4-epimerase